MRLCTLRLVHPQLPSLAQAARGRGHLNAATILQSFSFPSEDVQPVWLWDACLAPQARDHTSLAINTAGLMYICTQYLVAASSTHR